MPGNWDNLRLWINEQESAELRTGKPANLTPAQRNALSVLVPGFAASASCAPSPASPPAPRVGPEVDPDFNKDIDWISLLNLHGQQNDYQPLKWDDRTVSLGQKMPVKFELSCTVPDMDASFPNEDYGFVRGEAPCFSNKKDARKYAAMCAMRCINDLISPPRQPTPSPPSPYQSTPRHLPVKVEDPENTNGVPLKRANGGPSPSSDSDTNRAPPLFARKKGELDDEPDALEQVPALCKALRMTPPRFEVVKHAEDSMLFDAHPIYSDDSIVEVPPGLGVVTAMYSKKTAKEESASQVLAWLKELERERQQEFAGLSG